MNTQPINPAMRSLIEMLAKQVVELPAPQPANDPTAQIKNDHINLHSILVR